MEPFLDNSLFRNVYCYLSDSSSRCDTHVWGAGFLPGGWEWLAYAITGLAIIVMIVSGFLTSVLLYIWAERRLVGRFQSRRGPNRWGPFGLLTPVADAFKNMFKEDVVPAAADRLLFNVAPVVMVIPVFLIFTVIPFGSGTFLADLNIGVLFAIAVTSATTLAILMAGWGSGSRFGMFGGARAVAMLISYEIPMVIAVVGVVLLAGSVSMGGVVAAQNLPFALVQPLGALVFLIASTAEINRTPFDTTEAESELVAGYMTEYSSMKFGLFYLAEFGAAVASSAVFVTLFLGGWRGFDWLPSQVWFFIKLAVMLFISTWMRSSWPRMRIDQIMALAWKALFELTLVNLVAMAILVAIFWDPDLGAVPVEKLWIMTGINWGVFVVSIFAVGRLLGPKRHPTARTERVAAVYPPPATDTQAEGAE